MYLYNILAPAMIVVGMSSIIVGDHSANSPAHRFQLVQPDETRG
jgi:hypothetical protein